MSKKRVYYPCGNNDIAIAKVKGYTTDGRVLIKVKRIVNANFPDEEKFWRKPRLIKKLPVDKDIIFKDMESAVCFLIKQSQSREKEYEDSIITYNDLCFFPLTYDVTCDIAARNAYFNSLKKIQIKLLSGVKL